MYIDNVIDNEKEKEYIIIDKCRCCHCFLQS